MEQDEIVQTIAEQANDLCQIQDHVTRVVANLDIDPAWFSGYDEPGRAKFDLEAVALTFIYQRVQEFNQEELAKRLRGAAYVHIRLGLSDPLSQQLISHSWRNRFDSDDRSTIEAIAKRVRRICADHDVRGANEPALDPSDVDVEQGIGEQQILEAVELATELGFDEFSADRAPNAKYALQAYFERQGYLTMSDAGTTTPSRRFRRLSDRDEVPHGSTHNQTMKKVATPDPQTDLTQFSNGRTPPDWERIRDEVLPAFHAGVEKQLAEIADRDRTGLREPVIAAIDITTFPFWAPLSKEDEEIEPDEEPVTFETVDGRKKEIYPREDFPEQVSGLKEGRKRGYKFATITAVAENTPIVLGIEPVRDYRQWERPDRNEVTTTSRTDLVERLVEQAEQHIELHKVFCDREFDAHGVRDVLDDGGIQYMNGKASRSDADFENIQEIIEDPVNDHRIEHVVGRYNGREHKLSIVYLPGEEYSLFTANGWIDPDRAQALVTQYRKRWTIENQYKSIKANFLPQTASKDYRIRFLYLAVGAMLYNVWRLTNFVLRDAVDVYLGESPPILAGELVELVGLFLFEPGG